MKTRSFVWSIVYVVGLVLLFVGERLIGAGGARTVVSGLGTLLVVGATVVRGIRALRASDARRIVETWLLLLMGVGIVALVLYAAQSDVWAKLGGVALEKTSPKLNGVFFALWPALMALCLIPTLLVELSYASMNRAPVVESGRVRDALLSGVGVACALIFATSVYYVGSERDAKVDFSYFRTARPGQATRNIIRGLDEPVSVSVFFPPANEVREQVMEYLDDLRRESPTLEVESYDYALEPKKARELGVTGNGTVVLQRGGRKEMMPLGLELAQARGQLRKLDGEFQKRLLKLVKSRQTIYLTTGHGERGSDTIGPVDQRWTIRLLREEWGSQNYDVRTAGLAEGMGNEVPQDAAAVVIMGPTRALLPEEIAALERYLDRGGRIFLALDPDAPEVNLDPLLAKYGLTFHRTTLANDAVLAARTRTISDRANVLSASFSSHPAVTTLGRMGNRLPVAFFVAGSLESTSRPEGVRVDFTVHSHPRTWNDLDGDFEFDAPQEQRKIYELAAAVSKTDPKAPKGADGKPAETRMLVFADSDAFGDPIMQNEGNAYLAVDGMKWLLGEDSYAGETNSEEDAPITHTRKQDVAWFYSTVFAAPLLVLGVGFVFTRRGGRRRRASKTEASR